MDQSWAITIRYPYLIQNQGKESSISATTPTTQGVAINKFAL